MNFFLQGFQFENLKHANFSYCEFITKFHASCTPNLETLNLTWCKNLVEIDESFGLLKKLETCNLSFCSKLQFLNSFDLSYCPRLEKFPDIYPEMECLELSLSGTKLKPAYDSLDGVWMMRILDLTNCENIVELDFLMKPDCFPELDWLDLSGTKIITIPENLSRFPRLRTLLVANCKQLCEIQGLPQSIRYVHARNCMLLDTQSLLNQVYFSFFFF